MPIYLDIGVQSRYLMKTWKRDYDFEDQECPTEESLKISKNSTQPLSLNSSRDYSYDIEREFFVSAEWEDILWMKMITDFFELHILNTKTVSGWLLRSQLKLRKFMTDQILSWIITFIKRILRNCFWRWLEKRWNYHFLEEYTEEDFMPVSPNKLSILWFESNVTKQSFITFCSLIIFLPLFFIYWLWVNFERFKELISNEVYLWAILIFWIHIFDNHLPNKIIRLILNLFIRLQRNLLFNWMEVTNMNVKQILYLILTILLWLILSFVAHMLYFSILWEPILLSMRARGSVIITGIVVWYAIRKHR